MSRTKFTKILIIVSCLIVIIGAIPAFLYVYFMDRFYPNIYIGNINVSGMSVNQASTLINPQITIPQSLVLTYQEKPYPISISSLQIKVDKKNALEKGLKVGRSGNLEADMRDLISLLTTKKEISLPPTLNESYLDTFITDISQEINIPPTDAKFTITNNKVDNFALEKDGLELDHEALKKEIKNQIFTSPTQNITISIPTKIALAKVKAADLNNLGIKELIGTGSSHFTGSITTRIFNINLGASRINNALVAPNEEFSFNQRIGDISALSGYKQAYIIENGQTVLGDGGGVCQVSTTLFRAAMNSGLPITERHAHAYRVRYYEQDSSPGLDATIYTPTVDFKFKNDTENYILVESKVDQKNLVLTFNFYGTKDGRVSEVTKPVLTGFLPAPPDLYMDDPTLPNGEIKQVDFAATGIKSVFNYTVTKNGQIITNQTFISNFKPWQAKFLRGTKV